MAEQKVKRYWLCIPLDVMAPSQDAEKKAAKAVLKKLDDETDTYQLCNIHEKSDFFGEIDLKVIGDEAVVTHGALKRQSIK